MKKILALVTLLLPLFAQADWGFLPIMDSGYEMKPTVSGKYGSIKGTESGSESIDMMGVEFGLTCPLLSGPMPIRQQVSLNKGSKSVLGATVDMMTIELNPHMMFDVAEGLYVGFGPGFGYLSSTADSSIATVKQSYGAIQLGASAHYVITEMVRAGFEYRYQYTEQIDGGANNTGWYLKLGAAF